MIKNFIKIALRNLLKNKGYSIINIMGLSMGITCCLILFMVVKFELSFDNFHPNSDRIYRVVTGFKRTTGMVYNQGAPVPLHEALKNDLPDLEHIAFVEYNFEGDIVLTDNELQKYKEEHIGFANQDYFEIFQHEWLAGSKSNALTAPNQVVVSEKLAVKYFSSPEAALNQTVRLNNKYDLKISGVVKSFPHNSDFPFNVWVSLPTVKKELEEEGEWGSVSSSRQHFVLLPENHDISRFTTGLENIAKKYQDPDDVKTTTYSLQPLKAIHFDTRYGNFSDRVSGKEMLWALMAIGIFMIVTACINFINLATAQAVKRSKEVGVRKVLGSSKLQLSIQFLGETAIITFIAIIIAVVLVDFTLPYLNRLMALDLVFRPLSDFFVLSMLFGLFILVSLLSGFYPSLVLAGFKPVDAIKNKISSRHAGGFTLRRSLVVTQFVISQVLIIGTIVVANQMEYFNSKDLGFDKEAIITIPLPENDNNSLATLRNGLQEIPEVRNITFGYTSPSSDNRWTSGIEMMGSDVKEVYADVKMSDVYYPQTYGIELLAGRFYSESDTVKEVVVNETFVKKFGISDPNEILGREVKFWQDYPVPIVGVVKDFHAISLRDQIGPLLLTTQRKSYEEAGIKVEPLNLPGTLKLIETAWSETYPDYVFSYEFLDERIGDFYAREAQLNKLFQIFAGIAIFIGCLGLYGLVSFVAAQKTKEIGIRKVMGASVANILILFTAEFTKLVIIAFILAAPLAYYFMNNWLQEFDYKIKIGAGVFVIAIISSLFVALLTVGYKAINASFANPIRALKSE